MAGAGPDVVSDSSFSAEDFAVAQRMEDIMCNIEDNIAAGYPLQHRARSRHQVSDSYHELLARIITASGGDILYKSEFPIDIIAWCIELSSFPLASARHVGASTCMSLGVAVVKKVRAEQQVLANLKGQAGRRSRGAGIAAGSQDRITEQERRIAYLRDEILQPAMEGVFTHRYRDALPDIRQDMVTFLGQWIVQWPEQYLNNSCLKHFGWMLGDESVAVRTACCEALVEIFSLDPALREKADDFFARFKPVFLQLPRSTSADVAAASLRMLQAAQRMGGAAGWVTEDDVAAVCEVMMYREEEEVRHAAGQLFVQTMEAFRSAPEAPAGAAALRPTSAELASSSMVSKHEAQHDQLLTLVEFVTTYMGGGTTMLGYRLSTEQTAQVLQGGDALYEMLCVVRCLYPLEEAAVLRNWEAMLSLVMLESKDTGSETDIVMNPVEQCALLALIAAAAQCAAEEDTGKAARVDKSIERARHAMTELMCRALPDLLDKYRGNATTLHYVVQAALHMDMPGIPANQPVLFKAIIQRLTDIWGRSSEEHVVAPLAMLFSRLCADDCSHSSAAIATLATAVAQDTVEIRALATGGTVEDGSPSRRGRKRDRAGADDTVAVRTMQLSSLLRRTSLLYLQSNLGATHPALLACAADDAGEVVYGTGDSAIRATMGHALAAVVTAVRQLFSTGTALEQIEAVAEAQATDGEAPDLMAATRVVMGVVQSGFTLLQAAFAWDFSRFHRTAAGEGMELSESSSSLLTQLTDWRELLVDVAVAGLTSAPPLEGVAPRLQPASELHSLTTRLTSLKMLADLALYCRANMWSTVAHDIAWRPDDAMAEEILTVATGVFSVPTEQLAVAMGLLRSGWFSMRGLSRAEPVPLAVPAAWGGLDDGEEADPATAPLITPEQHMALGGDAADVESKLLQDEVLDVADIVNSLSVFLPLAFICVYGCNEEAQRLKRDGSTVPRSIEFPDQKPPAELTGAILAYDEHKKAGAGVPAKIVARMLKARADGTDLVQGIVAAVAMRETDAFQVEQGSRAALEAPQLAEAAGRAAHRSALAEQAEAEERLIAVRSLVPATARRLSNLLGVGKVKGKMAKALSRTLQSAVTASLAARVDPDGAALAPHQTDFLLLQGIREIVSRALAPADCRTLKAYMQKALSHWPEDDRQIVFELHAGLLDGSIAPDSDSLTSSQAHLMPVAQLLQACGGKRATGGARRGRLSTASPATVVASNTVPDSQATLTQQSQPQLDEDSDDAELLGAVTAPRAAAAAGAAGVGGVSQTQDYASQDEEEAELLANVRPGPQRRSSGAGAAPGASRRTKLPTVEEASNETSAEASHSTESAAAKPRRSRRGS